MAAHYQPRGSHAAEIVCGRRDDRHIFGIEGGLAEAEIHNVLAGRDLCERSSRRLSRRPGAGEKAPSESEKDCCA